MNDENKIGLSIEMYEDLKETLVKAVKSTKANAGLENAQLERIERFFEVFVHFDRESDLIFVVHDF